MHTISLLLAKSWILDKIIFYSSIPREEGNTYQLGNQQGNVTIKLFVIWSTIFHRWGGSTSQVVPILLGMSKEHHIPWLGFKPGRNLNIYSSYIPVIIFLLIYLYSIVIA